MHVTTANKIAAAIIANFGKRSNRPLLLSFAIFVAENPGCKTSDVASHFCPNQMHRSTRSHVNGLSGIYYRLDSLVKAGILVKDYETIFVPKHSYKSVCPGPGRRVKDKAAMWSLRQGLSAT